jgi:hypothetical protein
MQASSLRTRRVSPEHGSTRRKPSRRAQKSRQRSQAAQSQPRPSWTRWAPAVLWLSACNTGSIGEPSELDPGLFSGKVSHNPTSPPTGGAAAPSDDSCTEAQPSAAPPIARLTNTEYRNTLRTLLPELSLPALTLPADVVVQGFDNNAQAQTPSAALIEQYAVAAEAVGDSVAADVSGMVPCASDGDADACASSFIDAFVTRAYRRPLTADERTRYLGLFQRAHAEYGFAPAIGMLVQAALQSPHFLYRVEPTELTPLDGYALASRLSYFLWDDMPDEALLDAAASGELSAAAGVEAQARRMLDDARARPAVASLFSQWLRFDKMANMPKSAQLFPEWNEQVATSLRVGTERFVERVFWDMDGSLAALLTDTGTFVDANTAPLYGISDEDTRLDGMTLMDTDSAQRSGILTQAGLLAAFAHETADSPVLRGVFVMDRLLCTTPPPPPPGVTGSLLENPETDGVALTTRDRVALSHESGTCASCHHTIDGFGFGFSHYDAIGRWRDTDNGIAVNAQGWIDGTRDANGSFDGVVELGQRLANSTQVSDCVTSQFYRYSLGLGAAEVARCDVAPIARAFADGGGSMKELMITIATSEAFRNRGSVER